MAFLKSGRKKKPLRILTLKSYGSLLFGRKPILKIKRKPRLD